MPELPDIEVYLDALRTRIAGREIAQIRLASPFLLRSHDPPLGSAAGRRVQALRRVGKRIVIGLERELFLVLHLMIAGRLRWRSPGASIPRRLGLAAFDFADGTLMLTEAGTKKRASLHVVQGEAALHEFDPGGLEILESTLDAFRARLQLESHTLKRALTDPGLFSGIGNAYSDEILHRARLSPVKRTGRLTDEEIERLHASTVAVLVEWTERLRREAGDDFPEKVTAFRKEMAVHGRYREPCPDCGSPVQRIAYAQNEMNYCAVCQTGGKLLADRALSRLLRSDWPRTIEAWEQLRRR